jgi:hypothetical protein
MAKANQQQMVITKLVQQFLQAMHKESDGWVNTAITSWEIYKGKEWQSLNYKSFKEFVKTEFANTISYEMFLYKVKIGKVIEKYNLEPELLIDMGWTKFNEIAKLALNVSLEAAEVLDMIEEAKELPFRAVQTKIHEKYREANKSPEHVKFSLNPEQYEIYKEALQIARDLAVTGNPNVALTYICSEFIMHHAGQDSPTAQAIRKSVEQFDVE